MKTIKVPFNGKGRKINYQVETIDLSMTAVPYLNVFSVFIDDPELQPIVGNQFTILYHQSQTVKPCYDILKAGNIEEQNLKKQIAQQIINDPA